MLTRCKAPGKYVQRVQNAPSNTNSIIVSLISYTFRFDAAESAEFLKVWFASITHDLIPHVYSFLINTEYVRACKLSGGALCRNFINAITPLSIMRLASCIIWTASCTFLGSRFIVPALSAAMLFNALLHRRWSCKRAGRRRNIRSARLQWRPCLRAQGSIGARGFMRSCVWVADVHGSVWLCLCSMYIGSWV